MPTANFGTTQKRINSTARPALAASFSISFKQPCSMERPVLLLAADDSILAYNYFSLYSRYYWITDCVSVRAGLWEIHGEVDALATLRPAILGTSAFIEYAGTGYNTDLPDTRLMLPNKPTVSLSVSGFYRDFSPRYILTAAGQNGGLFTYSLNESQFNQLLANVSTYQMTAMPDITAGTSVMDTLKDFGNQLAQAFRQLFSFGSCLDAITNCLWVPWAPAETDVNYPIYLGDYATGVSAGRVQRNDPLGTNAVATFPLLGDWRDYSPYTRYSLFIPFVGVVTIPNGAVIAGGGTIVVSASYASETGEMAITVKSGNASGEIISSYSARIAADIKISRNSVNVMSIAGGAAQVLTGDFAAIPALAMSCLDRQLDSAGSLGSIAAVAQPMSLIAQTERRLPPGYTAATTALQGHTVNTSAQLSAYSGYYVQTRDAHISGSSEDRSITERAEGALNGGVYLE